MENVKTRNKVNNRIWELDFFRGIALICMIYFHVVYDLRHVYNYSIHVRVGINNIIGNLSAILFILISGISCTFSTSNKKRGYKVLGVALLISLFTHFYGLSFGVKFGILHFLGICILLYPYVSKLKTTTLFGIATLIIVMGQFIPYMYVNHDWFFFLGFKTSSFISSDYYPLIPWAGVFLYGISLGQLLYIKKNSLFNFSLDNNVVTKVGQKTLIIYLLHQPLILISLAIIHMFLD